jgi:hypothetical protein
MRSVFVEVWLQHSHVAVLNLIKGKACGYPVHFLILLSQAPPPASIPRTRRFYRWPILNSSRCLLCYYMEPNIHLHLLFVRPHPITGNNACHAILVLLHRSPENASATPRTSECTQELSSCNAYIIVVLPDRYRLSQASMDLLRESNTLIPIVPPLLQDRQNNKALNVLCLDGSIF